MYERYITYQQEVIFMCEKSKHSRGYTAFLFRFALLAIITTAAMFALAACANETAAVNNSGYNRSVENSNSEALLPHDQQYTPNDPYYEKPNATNEQTDKIIEDAEEYGQVDPTNEPPYATSEQTNTTNVPSEEPAAEQHSVVNNPNTATNDQSNTANTNQNSTTNSPPAEIEMTPLQREALARLNPARGYGVLAQTAGISTTQVGVGANQADNNQIFTFGADGEREAAQGMLTPTMRLLATSDISLLTEFGNNARQIIEGRMFQNPHEAIVSREFAELNNLSIGDIVEFASFDLAVTDIIRMELVGIYSDTTREFAPHITIPTPTFNRRNEIITTTDTLFYHPQFAVWLAVDSIRIP